MPDSNATPPSTPQTDPDVEQVETSPTCRTIV